MLEIMLEHDDMIKDELFNWSTKSNNLNESSFSNLFAYVVGNQLIEYR